MGYSPAVKLIDQTGLPSNVTMDEGMLMTNSFFYAVANGDVPGHQMFRKMGYSNVVSNTLRTLRPHTSAYVFPTAPIQMRVVSTSANDTASGTGIRTVQINYLDTNYEEQIEVVALNGTTPVNTVATNILRINDFYSITRGVSLGAVGTVSLQNTAGTVTYARVIPTYNGSQQLVYTVPAGKLLKLKKITLSSGSSGGANFVEGRVKMSMDNAGVAQTDGSMWTQYFGMLQAGSLVERTDMMYIIPEKTDILVDVIGDSAASGSVGGYIEGIIETL